METKMKCENVNWVKNTVPVQRRLRKKAANMKKKLLQNIHLNKPCYFETLNLHYYLLSMGQKDYKSPENNI